MTLTAPTFDDLDDPAEIRHRMLAAVATSVLDAHAHSLAVHAAWATSGDEFVGSDDAPLDVSPAAALADAFTEADASYSTRARWLGSRPDVTLDEYRAAADRAYEYAAEMIPSIVGTRITEARRAAGLNGGPGT